MFFSILFTFKLVNSCLAIKIFIKKKLFYFYILYFNESNINCAFYNLAINELMGLMSRNQTTNATSAASGREPNESEDHEHYKRVGQAAKEAFEYLEKTFADKNNKLKAITSQGSILDSMNFTNESFKAKVSSFSLNLFVQIHFILFTFSIAASNKR